MLWDVCYLDKIHLLINDSSVRILIHSWNLSMSIIWANHPLLPNKISAMIQKVTQKVTLNARNGHNLTPQFCTTADVLPGVTFPLQDTASRKVYSTVKQWLGGNIWCNYFCMEQLLFANTAKGRLSEGCRSFQPVGIWKHVLFCHVWMWLSMELKDTSSFQRKR